MTTSKNRIETWKQIYDLAMKELSSPEIVPPEIMDRLRPWLVLRKGPTD